MYFIKEIEMSKYYNLHLKKIVLYVYGFKTGCYTCHLESQVDTGLMFSKTMKTMRI